MPSYSNLPLVASLAELEERPVGRPVEHMMVELAMVPEQC